MQHLNLQSRSDSLMVVDIKDWGHANESEKRQDVSFVQTSQNIRIYQNDVIRQWLATSEYIRMKTIKSTALGSFVASKNMVSFQPQTCYGGPHALESRPRIGDEGNRTMQILEHLE